MTPLALLPMVYKFVLVVALNTAMIKNCFNEISSQTYKGLVLMALIWMLVQ